MIEALHPAQKEAFEKLKGLRVGALYIERQEGKLRTVSELIRYRVSSNRIDSVIWLCTRRRVQMIREGIHRYLPDEADRIMLEGTETLSHQLSLFLSLMQKAEQERVMLVIDNGLLIKNPQALRTQRVLALSQKCTYRLLISDVPLTRSAADMFSQWYALDWRILGYQTYWGFCVNHVDRYRRSRNIDYLARRIQPFCAQLLRDDVQDVGARKEYIWRFRLPDPVMQEYRQVVERFLIKAVGSTSGVYRLLQASQHVTGGRRIVCDYPLQTEAIYADPGDDPRIMSLLEVAETFSSKRVLVLCRYSCECDTVTNVLSMFYGESQVRRYPCSNGRDSPDARITVMNCYADERECLRLQADAIIYYSSDWNWRKRQEKERQCQGALRGGELTVVSLVAADTIDEHILRSVWRKDRTLREVQNELRRQMLSMPPEDRNAEDLRGTECT